MKITQITTALSFAALVAAVPAMAYNTRGYQGQRSQAQQSRGRGHDKADQQQRFRGMDRNGDGVITRDEWRGNDQSFRKHDRNGDGVISGDELRGNGRGHKADRERERENDRDDD